MRQPSSKISSGVSLVICTVFRELDKLTLTFDFIALSIIQILLLLEFLLCFFSFDLIFLQELAEIDELYLDLQVPLAYIFLLILKRLLIPRSIMSVTFCISLSAFRRPSAPRTSSSSSPAVWWPGTPYRIGYRLLQLPFWFSPSKSF